MRTAIIPVIHYEDDDQALRNAERASDAGCQGVLLIHMEGRNRLLPRAARAIKDRWPGMLVGMNFLGDDAAEALAANLACGLDMTWTDEQLTHSAAAPWDEASGLAETLAVNPDHLLFTGVAFKHQRHEPDPAAAAVRAVGMRMIPTTSGPATGVPGDPEAVAALRRSIGPDAPLAIASGITPDNVAVFAPHLSHALVATGVSASFHEFDRELLGRLRDAIG